MEIHHVPSASHKFKFPFEYWKRDGDMAYFKSNHGEFQVKLSGKEKEEFDSRYKVGDQIIFCYPQEMMLN